jgi:cation diffusion facilitator family transporter
MAGSKSVVMAALIANGAIAVLKFAGFLLTASPSMLSETYHSISDTGNQVFLLIGIRYGAQEADQRHPFGYGKAQFFYSFLVSVLLFGIAGWESAKHGVEKIQEALAGEAHVGPGGSAIEFLGFTYDPAIPFDPIYVNYVVLVGAIVFETWALLKARAEMRRQMEEFGWESYREAFRQTSDVTTLTALTEDTIALGGAGIALLGIFLSRQLGDPIYDAIAALLIGLMLMGFALALAWENKRLILGESLSPERQEALRRIVVDRADVAEVLDLRTVYFGPSSLLVTVDVAFDQDMDTAEMEAVIDDLEAEIRAAEPHVTKVYVEPT